MLASILVLPRMGVSMAQLEVPLHILLVTFQATWPIISEAVQETCLQRLTARARFNDGLPDQLASKVVRQFCDEHPERYLLAFVYGYLGDHDLLSVRTDAEKFLLLAALNLVDCVAFAPPRPSWVTAVARHGQDGIAGCSLSRKCPRQSSPQSSLTHAALLCGPD